MEITGSMDDATTHCALFGLATIIEDRSDAVPAVFWTDELEPHARIDLGSLATADVGQLVREHAAEHAEPDSWVQTAIEHEGREAGTFSPRIKAASSPEGWRALQRSRHDGIDALNESGAMADLRFIGALGEPAYWREADKPPIVDDGASLWEMKTRNRGEEFVAHRLSKLATFVAARSPEEVLSGLAGDTLRDEAGNDSQESRSATGLRRQGPTDNAVAWCALWGISMFPIVFRTRGRSRTAGAVRRDRYIRDGRGRHAIPVSPTPMTLARIRNVISSSHFDVALRSGLYTEGGPSDSEVDVAKRWLNEHGIAGLMRFPVDVVDNPSAPERRLLAGEIIRTGGAT